MKRLFFIAAVAAIALTSCNQENDTFKNENGAKNSISFVLQGGDATRAAEVASPVMGGISAKVGKVDGVSIYMDETITDLAFTAPETRGTPLYTENLGYIYRDKLGVNASTYTAGDVTYKQDGDKMVDGKYWCYGYEYPTSIWGDKPYAAVDFRMYMPAEVVTDNLVSDLTYSGITTSFSYENPETAVDSKDLVFGGISMSFDDYYDAYAKDGGAKVKLYHALTGVKFAIANPKKSATSTELEYDIQITKISIIGLANKADATFDPEATKKVNWKNLEAETGNVISQEFSATDLVTYDKSTDQNHFADTYFDGGVNQNINDAKASKTFWLIPQSIEGSDGIFHIEFTMSGKEQYMDIRLGDLKVSDWQAGQIRTYTFKLDEVNLKIEDKVNMAAASVDVIHTPWGDKNITSYKNSTKTDVKITNTGNTDAYIRAAIVGQWRDQNGDPVFGFTDFTHGVQLVSSWYEDQFGPNAQHLQGQFEGLPGTNWVKGDDGYYYYTVAVKPGQTIPYDLFTKYTVGTAPGAAIAGAVQEIYFTLEIATQAISAKKLDGTNYTYTEAWARANSFTE